MRYLLIMNPGSGGGSKEKVEKILTIFQQSRLEFDYKLTDTLEDAYTLSVEGNTKGYDVIVAVGGDGTINRVINGFYDSEGRRISSSKLGVIHIGTSPDLCNSYNIPLDIEQALNTVFAGKSQEISIGKITYTCAYDQGLEGQPIQPLSKINRNVQTSYFACCANFGLGASVARSANSGIRKYIGDYAGTFASLIKTLFEYKPNHFSVRFDGQSEVLEKVYNISVGKTTYIASGIKVKNQLTLGDKRFYALTIKEIGWADWFNVLLKLYRGKRFGNTKSMSLQYASSIEVYGNSKNPEIEFDGDPRGFLPCVIETARDPLDLICEVHDE
ncbi:diacylglycerol kinase [Desulfosporosinus fructosivorans]|uniref:Diacylglycerol kinase n=1 Tax=Desulfosporosinus fructosivorans TaxID=2018669 RepID=A0A4Z0R1R8_9FIRM|nr:diacylglycerol kinase family protein [Desulfosporosinus fructosivorans]TGE36325.1 diacylglycerol kinase [Desulfosporosinus fructosivorans]